MSLGKWGLFGAGALALTMAGCSCNTPPPTTNHLLREGERCEEDDQCETALCVALPREDKTCRRTCESGCRGEEICTTFGKSANGGLRAGCVPNKAGLCLPCTKDVDCAYAADACLGVGSANFCGRDCSFDGACPEGYTCTSGVSAEGGNVAKQCIPKSATCSCIPQTAGQKRACEIKNSYGRCTGLETCDGKEGYTGCDARVPADETCNAVDDDCDGTTDEGIPDQICGVGECGRTVKGCEAGVVPSCTPGTALTELCNAKDDNCDGKTDEGFDLMTVQRCGACDNACAVAHGTPGCKNAACYVLKCDTGFDDCDLKYDTGCETNLNTDKLHCGSCAGNCNLAFAEPKCDLGACKVDKCLEGHWNADKVDSNGCEYSCTPTNAGKEKCDQIDNDCNGLTDDGIDLTNDPKNCGACNRICPDLNGTPGCVNNACVIQCAYGYGDCDPLIPGCETNVLTSGTHCGQCGQGCQPANATQYQCTAGACVIGQCAAGFVNCNNLVSDGCEINVKTDPQNCGLCGKGCSVANGTPACNDGACAVGTCDSPWLNCDGLYASGCNINKTTSMQHCAKCNNACTSAPNSTVACGATGCVYTCTGSYQDCDTFAGCESNKTSDPLHCGSCTNQCPVPANSVATCASSTCGSRCQPGWADCTASPGCETDLDTLPTPSPLAPNCSASVVNLGTTSGDSGSGGFSASGRAEALYKYRLTEDNDLPISLTSTISLQSPANTRYGFLVSMVTCGGAASYQLYQPTSLGGTVSIGTSLGDTWGLDDDHDIFVEIVWLEGAGCGNWTLTIDANT